MDFTANMPCHVETIFFHQKANCLCIRIAAKATRHVGDRGGQNRQNGWCRGEKRDFVSNQTWFSPFSRGMRRTSNRFRSVIDHMPVNYFFHQAINLLY